MRFDSDEYIHKKEYAERASQLFVLDRQDYDRECMNMIETLNVNLHMCFHSKYTEQPLAALLKKDIQFNSMIHV